MKRPPSPPQPQNNTNEYRKRILLGHPLESTCASSSRPSLSLSLLQPQKEETRVGFENNDNGTVICKQEEMDHDTTNDNDVIVPMSSTTAAASTTISDDVIETVHSTCNSSSSSSSSLSLPSPTSTSVQQEKKGISNYKKNVPQQVLLDASLSVNESLLHVVSNESSSSSNSSLCCTPNETERIESANTTRTTVDTKTTISTPSINKTALVFESGKNHYDRHNKFHKERPLRIEGILDFLSRNDCTIPQECHYFNTLPVLNDANGDDPLSLLHQVHLPGYIQRLQQLSSSRKNHNQEERLDYEAQQYESIYFTKDSFQEAKKAAITLCRLVDYVVCPTTATATATATATTTSHPTTSNDCKQMTSTLSETATTTTANKQQTSTNPSSSDYESMLDNGFAIIRPPGHHAEGGMAGGYCILNNVALAATYILQTYPTQVQRIMILDWDIHHGNGTQHIFQESSNVLVISIHRWHHGQYYPYSKHNGGPTCIGKGSGKGYNVNVAWNCKQLTDEEYEHVMDTIVLPMGVEFQPDLILISAGFDAAQGDDVGECHLSPNVYGKMTRACMALQSRVVCTLEGGYKRSILNRCVEEVVTSLLQFKPCLPTTKQQQQEPNYRARVEEIKQAIDGSNASTNKTSNATRMRPSILQSIRATMEAHAPYWKCFQQT